MKFTNPFKSKALRYIAAASPLFFSASVMQAQSLGSSLGYVTRFGILILQVLVGIFGLCSLIGIVWAASEAVIAHNYRAAAAKGIGVIVVVLLTVFFYALLRVMLPTGTSAFTLNL